MKILVVGGGGREHAIAWKLAKSPRVDKVYCAPGNAGTAQLGENIAIGADDCEALLAFVKKESIDLTVVGPEAPLVKGIVDLFKANGQKIFGPSKEAARLEGSKSFMKEVLKKAGIPTAGYEVFTDNESACKYIKATPEWRHVVKVDGLAAGKGVFVSSDRDAAMEFSAGASVSFGEAGRKIIVEEFLKGEEASYIVVADGENFVPMASSQDHKRAFDGDKGPNTGGMGAYSPAPVITEEVEEKIKRKIIEPLLREMKSRGAPFSGFLYAGLMIENGEPTVLEFNVRLGDPEAQPLLCRYGGDLLDLLEASAAGDVSSVKVEWPDGASVCVVMASGGYPGSHEKGKPITGLDNCAANVVVFHAGTKLEGDAVVTSGGRVLGVTATAPTIKEAVDAAYACCEKIKWAGAFYRTDIGKRAIEREAIICVCQKSWKPSPDKLIEEFGKLREKCPVLNKLMVPDANWSNFQEWGHEDIDKAQHRPILLLAFKRGNLNKITLPLHNFLFSGRDLLPNVSDQYKQDLRELWLKKDSLLDRHIMARTFMGRVTELMYAQWLVEQGWKMIGTEALGIDTDLIAVNPKGQVCGIEIKYLGMENEDFLKVVESFSGGNSVHSISPYQATNFLICKLYEAANQLTKYDGRRVVALVISDATWHRLEIPLQENWINWKAPQFLKNEENWKKFLLKNKNSKQVINDEDLIGVVPQLHTIMVTKLNGNFELENIQEISLR